MIPNYLSFFFIIKLLARRKHLEMDLKYFVLILFCGHLNDTFPQRQKQLQQRGKSQSTVFRPSMLYISANSQGTIENPSSQPTQFNNLSSGQPITTAKAAAGQPTPLAYASFWETSSTYFCWQPLVYNVTQKNNTNSQHLPRNSTACV